MKKIIFALGLSLILFTGCKKNLDEKIYGTVKESEFWKTEDDFTAAINSAYGRLGVPWTGFSIWQFVIEDLSTDYGFGGYRDTYPFSTYTGWSSSDPQAINWGIWKFLWEGNSFSNKIIDNADSANIDTTFKKRVMAEAKVLRAFTYFNLVNWFGGMPLVTTLKQVEYSIPRATVAETYAQIEKDLTEAIPGLPTKEQMVSDGEKEYTRVSKAGAQGLLARVYLQQKKWAECEQITKEIVDSKKYSLNSDYANTFSLDNEGFDNPEILWSLAYTGMLNGKEMNGILLQVYLLRSLNSTLYSAYQDWGGDIGVKGSFYRSFEDDDARRVPIISQYLKDGVVYSSDTCMMAKYPADPNSDGIISGNDYIIVRYADVLLMRAEALNALGRLDEAIEMVNLVRNRAKLSSLSSSSFTQTSLSWHIYKERRWELYFEGHGKRDMARFGTLLDHIKKTSTDAGTDPERYLLLPIPTSALTANPALTQNPGYK